jgi:hypothetical protein
MTISSTAGYYVKMGDGEYTRFNNGNNTYAELYAEAGGSSSFKLFENGGDSSSDYLDISVTTHGATKLTTVDAAAAAAHFEVEADGDITLDAAGNIEINADGGTITFADAGSSLGTIDSNGFTGSFVGNVTGNAATATALTTGNKTIAGVLDITDTTDSTDATGDTGALRTEGGASVAKKLYVGSTITGSADVIAYSDKKLKENVKTLDGKKVLEMRGVSFDRIDTGKASSGVIAQEIEKVAPELVIDDGNYKGVAYGNLVGYLIEAIKDQQKQIDELKEICSGCSK